ncbi:MAG: metal ABC transporter permease [Syntrophales bacterium]
MPAILSYEFMQNAILAGIFASIVCGIIGPFIVTKRMVFISDGLSHTAFGGLGVAYWLGYNPLYGAVVIVLIAAAVIGAVEEQKLYRNDLLIGIVWAVGMAVGIAFIYMTPGYAPDLMTFLFGNILMVPRSSIFFFAVLVLIVIASVLIFYKGFVFITLDEQYARARQLPVRALNIGLMMLIALSIVTLIQVVGIVLVMALLTIPFAIASEFSDNFKKIMFLSILVGIAICLGGLITSYYIEFPSGASIVLIGGFLLGVVKGIKKLRDRDFSTA